VTHVDVSNMRNIDAEAIRFLSLVSPRSHASRTRKNDNGIRMQTMVDAGGGCSLIFVATEKYTLPPSGYPQRYLAINIRSSRGSSRISNRTLWDASPSAWWKGR
jgi:hypothetical protein